MIFKREEQQVMEQKFAELTARVGTMGAEISRRTAQCTPREQEAVKYLYLTAPAGDIGAYDFEVFLDFARHGLFLREQSPYCRALPRDLFLNYVLHYRVNTEEIQPCRGQFYEALWDLVADKAEKDAVLEVNYWCASEVTYQSTDERTAGPLLVWKNGYGRCGEESVFTVTALRSIGIAARQIYAPRWSHCDDNHAWVEVYCEGKWQFLGACEPEMEFNRGWFTGAAARAMMIHEKTFGEDILAEITGACRCQKQLVGKDGPARYWNRLAGYADTILAVVRVTDEKGDPVSGALVSCQVLNYAEFTTVAELVADEDGRVWFETGAGSLWVKVSNRERRTEGLFHVGKEREIQFVLPETPDRDTEQWQEFIIEAPADVPAREALIPADRSVVGAQKLQEAKTARLQKMQGFLTDHELEEILSRCVNRQAMSDILKESCANYEEVSTFLTGDHLQEDREALLLELSRKDYRDLKTDILEAHLHNVLKSCREGLPSQVWSSALLNPRIHNETLTAYCSYFQTQFTEEQKADFRNEPSRIYTYITAKIAVADDDWFSDFSTDPVGIFRVRRGDNLGCQILAVAICRTLGVPARLSPVDNRAEYYRQGQFCPLDGRAANNGLLCLEGKAEDAWKFKENWSLSRYMDGGYVPCPTGSEVQLGTPAALPAGRYRILTANRLPNGTIFAKKLDFTLQSGQERRIALSKKHEILADLLIETPLPEMKWCGEAAGQISSGEVIRQCPGVLLWLKVAEEPTEHILNELSEQPQALQQLGARILFLLDGKEALTDPLLQSTLKKLGNIDIYYHDDADEIEKMGRRLYIDFEKYPLAVVTGRSGEAVYAASGYQVGMGTMLRKIMAHVMNG